MKSLSDKYIPADAEKKWQNAWEERAVYRWDNSMSRSETYVIDTPPPTVSGMLHMGHIFSYTQADFVARFQRMSGKTVFYPMGFDDNGLPTERLVEKVKKVNAHNYMQEHGREGFIELCEGVAEEARAEFRALFQSIALSVDWEQEYHTISEESRRISQMSFLDLFGKERAYRKLQPMLWDPVDQTAIAQAEVEDKEMDSHFNDIHFGIEDSDEKIVIATTRPELLPACVAVFYHPEDERYKHLKGKNAVTPIFGAKVPVMEDDTVEPEKGTGIMMCCTFGDEADIEKWRKHELPTRVILNKYGKLEGLEGPASEELNGLKAKAARAKMIELLAESGDLIESKPHKHMVKCAERSGAPLEILPTPQWFVKVLDQKEVLKAKAAECDWYPKYMKTRMDQWVDG
ncbi:MAG: class I tRNA ligase family protein, partial [Rickettsiales bacterium]